MSRPACPSSGRDGRAAAAPARPCWRPEHLENLVRVGQAGCGVGDRAPGTDQRIPPGRKHGPDLSGHRQVTQVGRPRHAQVAQRRRPQVEEVGGVIGPGQRQPRIRAAHPGQQQRGVPRGAAMGRTPAAERTRRTAPARRWSGPTSPQKDAGSDARGGETVCDGIRPGDGRRGAAAAALGVAGYAGFLVGPNTGLTSVLRPRTPVHSSCRSPPRQLAEQRHMRRVGRRHVGGEYRRSESRPDPRRLGQVLDRDRQAVQRQANAPWAARASRSAATR